MTITCVYPVYAHVSHTIYEHIRNVYIITSPYLLNCLLQNKDEYQNKLYFSCHSINDYLKYREQRHKIRIVKRILRKLTLEITDFTKYCITQNTLMEWEYEKQYSLTPNSKQDKFTFTYVAVTQYTWVMSP